jgi:two-component system C4-dicarboxylate transport sensor histidine kinase DctB
MTRATLAARRLIEPMERLSSRTSPLVLIALVGAAMALAGYAVYHLSEGRGLETMRVETDHRLDMVAAATDSMASHHAHVPGLLELNPDVPALLGRPADPRLVDRVNHHLEQLNARVASIAIYLMDTRGRVLASSNWRGSDSFVGDDYSFRPYFQTAMRGRPGRYYAVGTTRSEPGYYVSHPLHDHGAIVGVAVIKIGLAQLEESQSSLGTPVLIADENGVVILSSVPDWKFRALAPLSPDQLAEIARTRRYNQLSIGEFPLPLAAALKSDAPLTVDIPKGLRSRSGENYRPGRYMMQARSLPGTEWRLLVFSDLRAVHDQAASHSALAVMAAGFIGVLLLASRQRQRYIRQKLESQVLLEKANADLERKVEERTAELVQAAKLAVLGRMAAGITHELAQPLGALRTLAGNAIEFMRRGDHATVEGNLKIIGELVDQMGSIIVPLKTFARKSPAFPQACDVCHVVASALFLLDQRLRTAGITVDNRCAPGSAIAWCDQNRLQQVLVNLIGNAIDAMGEIADQAAPRRLAIEAEPAPDGRIAVRVADTGPGLGAEALAHLFEPFFTTKPAGEGLGIGLAISQDIVRDFGGELSARNRDGGGAVFIIDLPAVAEGPSP